ncbi:MAG: RHS repeat protein, partial [Lentisphaerae bacterium]|nr:RHS repeat protein [Lentisphaerota bacterium]
MAPYWEAGDPRCPEDAFEFPGFTLTLADGTAYDLDRPGWALQDKLDPATGENYPVPALGGRLCLRRIRTPSGQAVVFHREGTVLVGISQEGQDSRALALARDPSTGLVTAAFAFDQVDSTGAVPQPAAGALPQVRYTYTNGLDGRPHLKTVERLRDRASGAYDTIAFDYYGEDDPAQTDPAMAHLVTAIREPGGTPAARLLYDNDGRLIGSIDAEGHTQSIDRDLAQRTETHVDRLGNPTVHGYDTRGNIVLTIDPLGHAWRWTYDGHGHPLTATDPLGNTTRYEVDANGHRTAITDPLGNTTRRAFDQAGRVTAITNPLGQTTRWDRDPAGRTRRVVDALGRTSTLAWDSAGRWTGTTAPDGTRHLNDLTAFPEQARFTVESADGQALLEWHEHYDPAGRLLSRRTWTRTPEGIPVEAQTDCRYDADGNPLRLEQHDGQATTWEYDLAGRCVATTAATGLTARRDLDACGRVRRVVLPDGQKAEYRYDANGRLVEETAGGRTTRHTYDAAGQLICLTRDLDTPVQSATWFLYDPCGRVVEQRCDERWQRWEYDACGRVVQQSDWSGAAVEIEYDAAGRPCAWRSNQGQEVTVTLDSIGRRTALHSNGGDGWRLEYDQAGRPIRETSRDGRVLEREFDSLGQLTRVRLHGLDSPDGGIEVALEHDPHGHRLSRTDARGRTTRLTYDDAGRLTAEIGPDGRQRRYAYEGSRLVQVVDPDGRTTRLEWDDLGRVTRTTTANPAAGQSLTRRYHYDSSGRLCRIDDDRGITLIDYDEAGREIGRHDPVTGSIGYAYDAAGRCVEVTSAAQTVACDYDPLGRLMAVRSGRDLATLAYDDVGRVESVTLPNGLTRLYDYDDAGRITRLAYAATAGGEEVASFAVDYDATGRCRRATSSDGLVGEFTYDGIGMLARETWHNANGLIQDDHYEYDAGGNRVRLERLGETLVYHLDSTSDRLLAVTSSRAGETQFDYDDYGALVAIRHPDGSREALTYDLERRLASWSRTGGNAPPFALEWDCDAWGNRVAERATPAQGAVRERLFRLDTASAAVPQRFDECSPDGTRTVGHIRGPEGLLWSHGPGIADRQTYLADPFQNIRSVLDADGNEVASAAYDAFGNALPGSTLTTAAFGYRGEPHHLDAGMVHLRARDYLTAFGRFASPDPFPPDLEA